MLDISLFREKPDIIKENLRKRYQEHKLKLVEEVISFDSELRKQKQTLDKLRHRRNLLSEEINKTKKQGKDTSTLLNEAKELPKKISQLEDSVKDLTKKIHFNLLEIPNILEKTVPRGKNEKDNKEIKKWGKKPKFSFELKSHAELIEDFGCADFDAGISNAGKGFNYLKKEIALLDLALQRYGVDFLIKNGFIPVIPPMLLNHKTLLGALNGLHDFEEVVYKVENEDLYLIGTAEHSLVSMLKNKTLKKEDLPLKVFAVTPCFRKEIGGHGIDMKWLFRMHQFNKVEQVVFTTPNNSLKMLEYMQRLSEKFFQSLKIPYRVVEICSGDLGNKFAKQWDIEAWFPRQNGYSEVTSAGSCTDYQAIALNIKYLEKNEKRPVHILNNTMVATSRAMVAIIENYQQKDGSIKIPIVLQPYMGGLKKISKK